MRLIHTSIAAMMLAMAVGCVSEPMQYPLPVYLSADDQKQVDAEWENLLSPLNKADRQTLLDTVVTGHMFENGVDRFHMRSEKYWSHGTVVMEADCDRAAPLTDSFTVTILDERGRTLRRERFLRTAVEESASLLIGWPSTQPTTQPGSTQPATDPSTGDPMTPQAQQLYDERNRRLSAVLAATEPSPPADGK